MRIHFNRAVLIFVALLGLTISSAFADEYLENLQPNQKIYDFKTVNLYENSAGNITGGRFISEKYGFIVDLMRIESVPQGYFWAKAFPTSSKGEPHACEHLLLGKGNKGRYVAALEDMALANSTAGTGQLTTGYHFNTTAGPETFYDVLEAKLNALINPDFTDEEIRREVCHIGIVEDPQTGNLSVDEKGTVYTEMVSSFQNPWYHTWWFLNQMIYGKNHILVNSAGGKPDVMRTMTVDDMRKFHKEAYHLSNMGAVISIPDNIAIDDFLKNLSNILPRCQSYEDSSPTPGIRNINFPPTDNAPIGTMKMVEYPSSNPEDPGYLLYAWPAYLKLDKYEIGLLELFLSAFSQGQSSNLYSLLVNSETRKIDIGCSSVSSGADTDMDVSIYFGLTGIENRFISETMLDSVLNMILGEIKKIKNYADDSEELKEFNDRIKNRLIESRKQYDSYLNSPPMFGFRRGPAGGWLNIMGDLEEDTTFVKSLTMKERFAYADSVLGLNKNIWKERIDNWKLLIDPPYKLGAVPNTEMIADEAKEKEMRLAGYIEDFKKQYGVDDPQLALAKYKEEFDANTDKLEAMKSDEKLPGFISNPPMTLDDQLKYPTITLSDGIPMTVSSFENMTSSN
ncbi:MAG: insulinase family protein, partial [Candidatus Zixiibacteriota bacterium]